jgi:DNA helicase-2/ATP-dependent DNA helicase PcrA
MPGSRSIDSVAPPPESIRKFETDFPGTKRLPLAITYRSQERVVRLFGAFTPLMRASAGGLPANWEGSRKDGSGEILMKVAINIDAEAVGLAQEIIRRRDEEIPFREQAILCRSHTNLARFALRLEAEGISVLYLGGLFERPEIRGMLALLSFTCEPERDGLLRVVRFTEYDVSIEGVYTRYYPSPRP